MKKIICLLLALLVVFPLIASCGGDNSGDTPTTTKKPNGTNSDNATGTEASKPSEGNDAYVFPDINMNDDEIFIMERWFGYGKTTLDFTGEVINPPDGEYTSTSVNVAKAEVIKEVQQKLNCTITGEIYTGDNIVASLREKVIKDVQSGTAEYDILFESYYYYSTYIKSGFLYDLNKLEGIDFSRDCWDQNAVKELSVCGSLYFGIGDINTFDNDGTFVVLFNKDLYKSEGFEDKYGSPYEMVENKTWTLDKLATIAKEATKNISGGEDLDEKDQWGLGTETSNLYLHCLAGGEKIAQTNSAGEPEITMLSERTNKILTDAVTLYTSGKVLVADDGTWDDKVKDIYKDTVTDAFLEGRELFYICGLFHVPYFRSMSDSFGILPMPMYDEGQERYYSSVSSQTVSCLMVPNHATNINKNLGYVIQALAELSRQKVTPEYYDKQLKGRDTRDDESAPMLDTIFENRTFDLGAVFSASWGDASKLYAVLDLNITSRFQRQKDAIEKKMLNDVTKIKEMQSKN